MKLYALKDVKVGFNAPVALPNDEVAIRMYKQMLASGKDSVVTACPQDFELWSLGAYDQDTGAIIPDCKFLMNAAKVGE